MVEIGKMNRLKVVKEVDFGLYLDGGLQGEILLPVRYVPEDCNVGDEIEVFIYRDSEDRIIATTEKPYVMVGEFACLKVVSLSRAGAFLDWGLPKDLLVPFSEQIHRMDEGKRYVVGVYLDTASDRITASARLDDMLYHESEDDFEPNEEVDLFVSNKTDLGYQVIINNSHLGLLHNHEVVRPLKRGEKIRGFIRSIRDDGKIDVTLHLKGHQKIDDGIKAVLKVLKAEGGFAGVTDRSPPEVIDAMFGISKGMFKKAIGSLYKRKLITLENDGIRLVDVRAAKKH
ncbi:MAG: S1-like domain-containing RNA-binding protein [Mariprofundaceae bacterium]|nr:S1-like domain-containing RNA-binding protein [Mariprofundaceae bacterium]